MAKLKHIMVDIESMGNTSNSAIISIGAVKFDISTGKTGDEFYTIIDLQSCLDIGLTMDASTVLWWMQQSDEARKEFTKEAVPIEKALEDFSKFFNDANYEVWGNSARFDLGLLNDAYNKLKKPIPWKYYNERCVRTLVSFNRTIKKEYPVPENTHNAIIDCYYQIGYCSQIWKTLKIK